MSKMKSRAEVENAFKLFSAGMMKYPPSSIEFNHLLSCASVCGWILCEGQYERSMDAVIKEMQKVIGNPQTAILTPPDDFKVK